MRLPNRFLLFLIIALIVGLGYVFGQPILHSTNQSGDQKAKTNRPFKPTNKASETSLTIDGKKAPRFELETLDGGTRTLDNFKGKALLLVTWATWCKECHEELQTLQKEAASHNTSFKVVLINMSSEEISLSDVREYVTQKHLTLPVLLDKKGNFEKSYHVQVIPTSVLIDPYGNVLHTFYGPEKLATIMNWLPSA